MVQNCWRSW